MSKSAMYLVYDGVSKRGCFWYIDPNSEAKEDVLMSSTQSDEELLAAVNSVIGPMGCKATELGPDAVGVMGDGRAYGASVYVSFPADTTPDFWGRVSSEIINKVHGITRVLMNIETTPALQQGEAEKIETLSFSLEGVETDCGNILSPDKILDFFYKAPNK